MIKAANLLLEQNKIKEAKRVLRNINVAALDAQTRAELILSLSSIALLENNPQQAEELLTTDSMGMLSVSSQLPPQQLNRVSLLRAQVWEQNQNFLAAARERIFVAPMLDDAQMADHNHQLIWDDIMNVPEETLQQLSGTVAVEDIQGWLELGWIYKGLQDDLDQQVEALNHWIQQHPTHPAAIKLPETLRIVQELSTNRPTEIAVLLPMQGKYRLAAEALLNGFMAAHYATLQGNPEFGNAITIRTYDTHDVSQFSDLYQKAVNEGADIIIGPLQKENLRSLLSSNAPLPVPTIAMNQEMGTTEFPPNLYQFGLSPEDDAAEVARYAQQFQFKRAAVLYQDNPWWSRAYAAFTREWMTHQEHAIPSAASFEDQSKMANAIKEMLLVHQSEQRAQQLQRITGKSMEFQPRRRQDLDFIFLIASPEQARQIRPLLDFYYAQGIPVLAGSQIYGGQPAPQNDRDLNGIKFCDIPWLLEKPGSIHSAITTAWPKADHRYFRFNAMGVDAYRLQSRLQLLAQIPDAGLFGATGNLTINPEDNRIHRELSWAVFKGGSPQLLPKIIDTDIIQEPNDKRTGKTTHPEKNQWQSGRSAGMPAPG